jgi:hypothetical protein
LNQPAAIIGLLLLLLIGVGLTGYRVYRQYSVPARVFDWQNRGHSDFHNGTYFPSMAFRDGVNPYSLEAAEVYELSRSSPLYSPVLFIWHLPFTYLDVLTADVAFFMFNCVLLGLLVWLGLYCSGVPPRNHVGLGVLLMAALVLSRPGHITLFTGYFTLELVIGTVLAVHFAETRPWLAGVGMLLASGKPTYILPLIVLMLFRGNVAAVVRGIVLCTVGGLVGLGWLAFHSSPLEVLSGINEGRMALHNDPTEIPMNTWTRLDSVGVVSKLMHWQPNDLVYLLSMLVMLVVPGLAIRRLATREENRGATGLSGLIICLTILVSIYHHSYDSLWIVVPWLGLAFFHTIGRERMSSVVRWTIVVCLAVPAANYLSTRSIGERLGLATDGTVWQIATSANGACLLLALLLAIGAAYLSGAPTSPTNSLSDSR